jgi:hypothetical protein
VAYEPATQGSNGGTIAGGTLAVWIVGALVSVFVGSWVTGRMKKSGTRGEAGIHGALVWATGAVVAAMLATVSLGVFAGSAVSLLGDGMKAAATGASAAVPAVAQIAAPTWDAVKDQLQVADARTDAPASDDRYAERSRLMQLLGQAFPLEQGAEMSAADRKETAALLATQLKIAPDAAQRTLDQWQRAWQESVAKYEAAKEEAKHKAIEAATIAKRRTAQLAITAFVSMIIGLTTAVFGALSGYACACSPKRVDALQRDRTGQRALA